MMRKPFTIKELYDKNRLTPNSPFLGNSATLAKLPFMTEYLTEDMFPAIDRQFSRVKGFFHPQYNADEIGTADIAVVLAEFQFDIESMLMMNKANYQRLYDLKNIEYKPIDNYNMIEQGSDITTANDNSTTTHGDIDTTQKIGAVTVTKEFGNTSEQTSFGATNKTISYGEGEKTTSYGAENVTENLGVVSETDTLGTKTDTNTTSVQGFNASDFKNSEKVDATIGGQTNEHTENARINSTSKQAKVDTEKEAAKENTESEVAHTDTRTETAHTDSDATSERDDSSKVTQGPTAVESTKNNTFTHELTRSGNIGVTTSQQMAQSEIDLWTSFKFYEMIFDDIVNKLCNFYDDGYDTFLTPLWNVRRGEQYGI